MTPGKAWLRFGLTILGCGIGGFTLACLVMYALGRIVTKSARNHLT